MPTAADPRVAPPRSLGAMVWEVMWLGLLGFGGVGPQSYHLLVERTRWLSADEYADLIGVGQALPGANTVNLVAICGDRWYGPLGAAANVAAFVGPPTVIVVVLAALLSRAASAPRVVAVECAVAAACAGLILANAVRVFATIRRRRGIAFVLGGALAAAVTVRSADMPIATIVAVLVGFACEAFVTRRA